MTARTKAGWRALKKFSGSARERSQRVLLSSAMYARACLRWGPGRGQTRKPSSTHSLRRVCRWRVPQVASWCRLPHPNQR
eukprot:11103915-Alexandrium_andersonii.AAC.1